MIDLAPYQRAAVHGGMPEGLAPSVARILASPGPDRLIVLTAPTGAGKTVMLAAALDSSARDAAVLWLTPGKGRLADQTTAALTRHLDTSPLVAQRLTEQWLAANPTVDPGVVLVANWESLTAKDATTGQRTNRLSREGEARSLFDALRATAAVRTPLVVVVDESHWGARASGTTELLAEIDAVSPALRIETSATPTRTTTAAGRAAGRHADVFVDLAPVIAAGMLATEVRVNTGLRSELDALPPADLAGATGESLVLDAAWRRLQTLTTSYGARRSPVRPLMLIQIPDGKAGEAKLSSIEAHLAAPHIGATRGNGRVAVWLSEDKTPDLDRISRFDAPAEVLVFKQAVALGWDCPRAQVLVAFREMRSEIFAIQTVGRILRTAERRHYGDGDLDAAYIYANIDAPTAPSVAADDRPVAADVTLTRQVGPLALPAGYASRAGSYDDVKPALFRECFARAATDLSLLAALPVLPSTAAEHLAADRVVSVDAIATGGAALVSSGSADVALSMSEHDLLVEFDRILSEHLGPYRARARSLPVMRQTLYDWVRTNLPGWRFGDDADLILAVQRTAIAQPLVFGPVLDLAVEHHRSLETVAARRIEAFDWELPAVLQVSSETHNQPADPAGYAYADGSLAAWRPKPSGPEVALETFLAAGAAAGRILWWWKNGVGDRRFFSLSYTRPDGSVDSAYPDYIIELPSRGGGSVRRIAVLEAKAANDDDPDTTFKARRLAEWASGTPGGCCVTAGIVAPLPGGLALNDGSHYSDPSPAALTDPCSGWVELRRALRATHVAPVDPGSGLEPKLDCVR